MLQVVAFAFGGIDARFLFFGVGVSATVAFFLWRVGFCANLCVFVFHLLANLVHHFVVRYALCAFRHWVGCDL